MSTQEFWFSVNAPIEDETVFNTLVTRYEDGKEQRRAKWSRAKGSYTVILRGRTQTVAQQVWDFFTARQGAYDTFYFENPNENPVTNEIVGSGDSIITSFTLDHYPLPSGSITITADGVAKAETTDYTLTRTTGAIEFSPAPSGIILGTYNFCRVVRFAEDKLTREQFTYQAFNVGVQLVEVLSAT